MHVIVLLVISLSSGVLGKIWKPQPFKCRGDVPYYDAPIIYYYNVSATLCFADREGCTPREVKKTYSTLDECIKEELPDGRTITAIFTCDLSHYKHRIFTTTFGKDKQIAFPILRGCGVQERFCPPNFDCMVSSAGSNHFSCCHNEEKGNAHIQTKYSNDRV